jgi:hypothetical protein
VGVWVHGGESNWGLVVVKFSFSWDKVYEVFDGYLMYVFHEYFDFSKGCFKFS